MLNHTATILLLSLISLAAGFAAANEPPNIVLIVADDLGWTDLGCFGSRYYQTPHVDRLCNEGTKFTSAYSCGPNCAPTRACLMSGMYSPRHGVYTVGTGARGKKQHRQLIPVENKTTLALSFVTLGEVLHDAGYVTAHFGKWHLGQPAKAGPEEQGFDFNFGGNHSGQPQGGYFSPYNNPQLPDGPEGENLTDRMSDEAVQFIEQHREKRFFVYLAYYAVHSPIQAKAEVVARYVERKPRGGHRNPKYAAMIETMDTGIGRILETLDNLKLADRTVIVFYSDNGGTKITSQAPLRGRKGMLYEGGVRVPLIVRWPGVTKPGSVSDTPVNSVDFLPTLAEIAHGKPPKSLDGTSITALLKNPDSNIGRQAIYWHFPGYLEDNAQKGTWRTTPAGAIRVGDWKLIEFFEDNRLELYNLRNDIGEANNLAETNSTQRDELYRRLVQWRKSVDAPIPKRKN